MQRRNFLKLSALGIAGTALAAPSVLAAEPKAAARKKTSANGKIALGFIGLGQQANYLVGSFLDMDDVQVVAGCDVYDIKRDRFFNKVAKYYQEKGYKHCEPAMYEDYQELLARPDIDGVVIAVPDHWHAIIAIAACKAGKDVYLEKPMTLTVYEGKQLVKAVRKYNRILQVGSMQRSSDEFIHAANVAREGELGKIHKMEVFVGRWEGKPFPVPHHFPAQTPPAGLNWDKWLGPMEPSKVTYFPDIDPLLNDEGREDCWGAWRWYKPTGGGYMTDWGAHMFDIAQWMVGKDLSCPVDIIPPGYSYYKNLTYRYDNGIEVEETTFDDHGQGVKIYGENGWLAVHRGMLYASDPKFEMKKSEKKEGPYESCSPHHRAFIDSMKSRIDPNVPVEVGHSSCTMCNIGIIAGELGRPLVWNPIVQKFMNDDEANKLMHYQYRSGYEHLLDV
ncbi:MAG: Gfo/Idh/MocA family oxidoreductase [Alistipes sp.]|nr:Gfo/Idh/MocA family oxidoreductase [Candidatus Minthomonas equi]